MNAKAIVNKLLETGEDDPVSSGEAIRLHGAVPHAQREGLKRFMASKQRENQYIENYLILNGARGDGKGQTTLTFLAGHLKGKAKEYVYRYAYALEAACKRRVELGLAFEGKSAAGHIAYYPVNDEEWDRVWSSVK